MGEECIAEEVFVVPDTLALDCVFDDAVDYLVVEGGESVPVFLQVQGFGLAGEGRGRFDYHKVVYLVCEGVQADFEPVEFGGHQGQVVDFSFGVLWSSVGGETMRSTSGLDFIG